VRFLLPAAVLALTATAVASPALAQQTPPPPVPHPVAVTATAARPGDVSSIDSIIVALYDVISGPVGQRRDWDRLRSLFIPGGRLIPTGMRPDGAVRMRLLEVNDYIATSGPLLERIGFREREIARRVDRFGNIAHVFSTYEGRGEADATPIRGINSIQLIFDGTRWWVVSVYWQAESPGHPLPPQYLPNAARPE
jgi:hypothetical protein